MARDIKCEIIREIGIVSTSPGGWDTLLAVVSWNGAEPKYDIRDWNPERTRCSKGKTFSAQEMEKLASILSGIV